MQFAPSERFVCATSSISAMGKVRGETDGKARTSAFSSGASLLPTPCTSRRGTRARKAPGSARSPSKQLQSHLAPGRDLQQQKHLWHQPEKREERGRAFWQNPCRWGPAEGKKHQTGKIIKKIPELDKQR